MYMLFCFFKLFPIGCIGLTTEQECTKNSKLIHSHYHRQKDISNFLKHEHPSLLTLR